MENLPLAKAALAHWDHDSEDLDRLLGQFRISSNAVYPFRRAGRLCFLRLAPTEEKLEANLTGELEFLEFLQDRGFPAHAPLPAKDGRGLLTLETPWGSWFAMAFAGVPGTRLDKTPLTPPVLQAYGRALGVLHTLSRQYQPRQKKWSCWQALDWTAGQLSRCNAPDWMGRALEDTRRQLEVLPRDEQSYGLIHYDFELDNVFFHQQTGQCWAIDFDDGMYHWYAADLWQALDSLGEALSGAALEQGRALFLEGYRQAAPLPPDWEQMMPLMERFVRLYGYGRLLRCVAEAPAVQPEWMGPLLTRFQKKLRQVEAGFRPASRP